MVSKVSRLCVVCQLRKITGQVLLLCRPCARSYDRYNDGTTYSIVAWAATRTRRFLTRSTP